MLVMTSEHCDVVSCLAWDACVLTFVMVEPALLNAAGTVDVDRRRKIRGAPI
jgi:hypothetical protein